MDPISIPLTATVPWHSGAVTVPAIYSYYFDKALFLLLVLLTVASRSYLQHWRLVKLNGCQNSRRKAPVRDPFLGIDFLYERLLRATPPKGLAACLQDFRTLGPTYLVSRWTTQAIHTCDARNIKHLLASSFEDFRLPDVRVSVLSEFLGMGIFTLDGEAWSYTRSLIRPTLTRAKMALLPDILEHHVQALLAHVQGDGTKQDLQPLFFKVTMDVASEYLLGHSTNMLGTDDSSQAARFVEDYMTCSIEAVKKMRLGPLSFLRFNSTASQAKKRVFEYMDDYIHESLRQQKQNPRMEASFLQELANAMGHGRALRDQVLHIFLASRDTTASLLSNLFFALTKKPDVYAKLRKEVMETVGDCSAPTFEQLKNITYLKWCINECES
jgi:cytochrome P450